MTEHGKEEEKVSMHEIDHKQEMHYLENMCFILASKNEITKIHNAFK